MNAHARAPYSPSLPRTAHPAVWKGNPAVRSLPAFEKSRMKTSDPRTHRIYLLFIAIHSSPKPLAPAVRGFTFPDIGFCASLASGVLFCIISYCFFLFLLPYILLF